MGRGIARRTGSTGTLGTSTLGMVVVALLVLGCGEASTRAGHAADARTTASGSTQQKVARLSGAVLTDADLGGAMAVQPAAPAVAVADAPSPAPLPPEVAQALVPGRLAIGDTQALAISFGDAERDLLRSALDGTSVLDDPLPPAAPDPDTSY